MCRGTGGVLYAVSGYVAVVPIVSAVAKSGSGPPPDFVAATGSVAQQMATSVRSNSFGHFRSRTPGPPPFSSMNSAANSNRLLNFFSSATGHRFLRQNRH